MSNRNDGSESASRDLIATGVVAFVYFAYMLFSVDLRDVFARPISAGTVAPWGLVGGVGVVVLVMVMAAFYMMARNRADRRPRKPRRAP